MTKEEDTSVDEHLTEEEALARAKEEGYEFVDFFTVEGDLNTRYETEEEAIKAADGKNVLQHRTQK